MQCDSPFSCKRRPAILILQGHGGAVRAIEYSVDGLTLLSGSEDGTVRLWDVVEGSTVTKAIMPGPVYSLSHFNETMVVSCDWEQALCCRLSHSGIRTEWYHTFSHQKSLSSPSSSGRGAVSPQDGTILLFWQRRNVRGMSHYARNSRLLGNTFPLRGYTLDSHLVKEGARRQAAERYGMRPATALAFSPCGRIVAGGGYGMAPLVLWDMNREPSLLAQGCRKLTGPVYDLAFSPCGKTLAVAREKGTVVFIDSATQKMKRRWLYGHKGAVWAIEWSRNGSSLLSGSADGMVWWWDVATGKPINKWDWKIGRVFDVAFSPLGMTAAAAGENGEIVIWDLE